MSKTTIEWTQRPGTVGETWNPTTGCNKVDRGCKNCYTETMHHRLQAMGQEKYQRPFLAGAVEHPETLSIPFSWKKPRTVFVNSMSDLFHPAVSFEFISEIFGVMESTSQHTYLVLTKRPERALEFWEFMTARMQGYGTFHCPANVWMGTSANDQSSAKKRVPLLLKLTNCLRFLSYEPATGSLDLRNMLIESWLLDEEGVEQREKLIDPLSGIQQQIVLRGTQVVHRQVDTRDGARLHWVIAGGESGPKASPMHPDWVRKVRDACEATGTPFFFKQWGAWEPSHDMLGKHATTKARYIYDAEGHPTRMIHTRKKSANLLDGKLHQAFPS